MLKKIKVYATVAPWAPQHSSASLVSWATYSTKPFLLPRKTLNLVTSRCYSRISRRSRNDRSLVHLCGCLELSQVHEGVYDLETIACHVFGKPGDSL
ncbi:hypothetical protein J6590_012608 [Homalodisca vitripennis]|nr:hypothetical protein J6590_012608 [Homalodisca vitripennis]